MKWLKLVAAVLVALNTLVVPQFAVACPLCADAIANSSNGADEEERNEFPLAMNRSIYLMVSVPYVALGVVGFMVYRGARKNDEYLKDQPNG